MHIKTQCIYLYIYISIVVQSVLNAYRNPGVLPWARTQLPRASASFFSNVLPTGCTVSGLVYQLSY